MDDDGERDDDREMDDDRGMMMMIERGMIERDDDREG